MSNASETIEQQSRRILESWLESCRRSGRISRNTIAVGIVVLDHLRRACPTNREAVLSPGGEVKGARSGLGDILEGYGVSRDYLKEVTTRQGAQDGQRLFEMLGWGDVFAGLAEARRDDLLNQLIGTLAGQATDWLNRQNLRMNLDRRQSPAAWVHMIVENARSRSGGVVEQHLVGAKLERRHPQIQVPNHPAHAADRQTAREGDFSISGMVYHVTATPGRSVIEKCAANLKAGKSPILLVPREREEHARAFAEDAGIDQELTIFSIESFIAMNIIELAMEEDQDFFGVLQEIVQIYNRRLAEVETDLSLQIETR